MLVIVSDISEVAVLCTANDDILSFLSFSYVNYNPIICRGSSLVV